MTSCCPHTPGGPHSALCHLSERQRGRDEVLQALRNLVVAQELEALAELSPNCRRHMLHTIDLLRALIEVEEIKP